MSAIVELIEKVFDKYFLGTGTSSIRPESEVAKLIRKGACILDVRTPFEAKKGMAPGATNISLLELNRRLGELPCDRRSSPTAKPAGAPARPATSSYATASRWSTAVATRRSARSPCDNKGTENAYDDPAGQDTEHRRAGLEGSLLYQLRHGLGQQRRPGTRLVQDRLRGDRCRLRLLAQPARERLVPALHPQPGQPDPLWRAVPADPRPGRHPPHPAAGRHSAPTKAAACWCGPRTASSR